MYIFGNSVRQSGRRLKLAGQGPSRRELLEALGLASAASVFAGFSRWSYAFSEPSPRLPENTAQHLQTHASHAHVRAIYQPQFFSADEYQTVETLVDLILPATHAEAAAKGKLSVHKVQPGAKDAGVAEFIDFSVATDLSLQAPFRNGLAWLDQASTPAAPFASLPHKEHGAILERLAYKAKYRSEEKTGQQFFRLFRKYTVTGFYTSRIGLEALDYPGLTFYATSPGCTHEGNPEHVGL